MKTKEREGIHTKCSTRALRAPCRSVSLRRSVLGRLRDLSRGHAREIDEAGIGRHLIAEDLLDLVDLVRREAVQRLGGFVDRDQEVLRRPRYLVTQEINLASLPR